MIYTSVDNHKMKNLKKLQQKKYRDETELFLIEGEHLIEEALHTGYLKEILIEENYKNPFSFQTSIVTKDILKQLSNLESTPHIMGVCQKMEKNELGDQLLLLDDIQDPGNLGTIIRSAVAFHIDTILLSENSVDAYNPKVIRASQGMIFHLSMVRTDLKKKINELKKQNYMIYGTKVTGGKNIKTLEKSKKFAIIMGNEGNGVKDEILSLCDEYLLIPMKESCESLNVGVATSIILYELDK